MTVPARQDGQSDLPTPDSTASYWHREPSRMLASHRTTTALPSETDVVVIGSGITGAFAANELCRKDSGLRIVMLEAREACWGATGRNGGHCQPLLYLKSVPVASFELATFDYLDDLIVQHNVPCDWKVVGGVHPIKTKALLAAVQARVRRLEQLSPALATKVEVIEDPEKLKALRVEAAVGAVFQPNAAKCWPYKLVTWLLEGLVRAYGQRSEDQRRFNLQTNTPATGLQKLDDGSWIVHTPRGQIATRQVLIATNAYTSQLLPKMTGLIVPVRGQVSALRRPQNGTQLQHSYAWMDHQGGDNYLIHRDDDGDGGPLILGGERLVAKGAEVGISGDDVVNEEVAAALRTAMHGTLRLKQDKDHEEEGELKADYEWTGIMGYSRDDSPWVGAVPDSLGGGQGLWMSAGYTGHGMPVAARTGIAVAEMIMGSEGKHGAVVLPEEYLISEERVTRAKSRVERTLVEELEMLDPR